MISCKCRATVLGWPVAGLWLACGLCPLELELELEIMSESNKPIMMDEEDAMAEYGLPAKLAHLVEAYQAAIDDRIAIKQTIDNLNKELATANTVIAALSDTKRLIADFADQEDQYSESELAEFADIMDYYFAN